MKYEILAVRGMENETAHAELRGAVAPGSRNDCELGMVVEIVDLIDADSAEDALVLYFGETA